MGTKIKGQYMNRSTFWMIKYMNGSVFSKARYMNGVGFEILARTLVPKLPLSYPPPQGSGSAPSKNFHIHVFLKIVWMPGSDKRFEQCKEITY